MTESDADSPAQSAPSARLKKLLSPRGIVLIGVSRKPGASRHLLESILEYGFNGDLYIVNPSCDAINNVPCFPSVQALPGVPDLALVVVPAPHVPRVVRDCGEKGIAAAVIFSAGFADDRGMEGQRLQRALSDAIQDTGIRVVGPNCLGYLNIVDGITATWSSSVRYRSVGAHFLTSDARTEDDFEPLAVARGNVAIIAQSGGLGFSLFNRGLGRGVRFSYIISTGNEVDLEVQDFLQFLLDDPDTRVILLYIEGLKDLSRFQSLAARAEAVGKALVMAKVGRSKVAARAVMSHTGHIAGDDAAFGAVFERYGILRVHDPEEMLDLALVLSTCPKPTNNRVGIVSYSGGNPVWMADACEDHGIDVPTLTPAVQARLEGLLPSFAAIANPVDISGASKATPVDVLRIVAEDTEIDSLILIASYARSDAAQKDRLTLTDLLSAGSKPVLVYSYTEPAGEALRMLAEIGIPVFTNTMRCARALQALVTSGAHVVEPALPPCSLAPDTRPLAARWDTRASTVAEHEVKALLRGVGIPVTRERLVTTRADAAAAADALGYPVALKLQSPNLPHKARAGGVALSVGTARAVEEAFDRVLADVASSTPDAVIEGVLVQEMLPPGVEVLIGVHNTSGLGPMIMVGLGGAAAEILGRTVLYPAPFGETTARRLLQRVPVAALLGVQGITDVDAALASLSRVIADVSALAADLADLILEMDLNPVIVDLASGRAVVADAVAVPVATPSKKSAHA